MYNRRSHQIKMEFRKDKEKMKCSADVSAVPTYISMCVGVIARDLIENKYKNEKTN